MKLEILDPKNLLDRSFIEWLKIKIRDRIISSIDDKKLIAWDDYLNNNPVYKSIYKKKISSRDILISGAMNLNYIKSESNIIIHINSNIFAPGLDRIKLETICKLINFGNLEMKAYPIFIEVFEYFAENIADYVDMYLLKLN